MFKCFLVRKSLNKSKHIKQNLAVRFISSNKISLIRVANAAVRHLHKILIEHKRHFASKSSFA